MSAFEEIAASIKIEIVKYSLYFGIKKINENMTISEINRILYIASLSVVKNRDQNILKQILEDFNDDNALIALYEEFHEFAFIDNQTRYVGLCGILFLNNFQTFFNTPKSLIDLINDDNCSECGTLIGDSDDESDDTNDDIQYSSDESDDVIQYSGDESDFEN